MNGNTSACVSVFVFYDRSVLWTISSSFFILLSMCIYNIFGVFVDPSDVVATKSNVVFFAVVGPWNAGCFGLHILLVDRAWKAVVVSIETTACYIYVAVVVLLSICVIILSMWLWLYYYLCDCDCIIIYVTVVVLLFCLCGCGCNYYLCSWLLYFERCHDSGMMTIYLPHPEIHSLIFMHRCIDKRMWICIPYEHPNILYQWTCLLYIHLLKLHNTPC